MDFDVFKARSYIWLWSVVSPGSSISRWGGGGEVELPRGKLTCKCTTIMIHHCMKLFGVYCSFSSSFLSTVAFEFDVYFLFFMSGIERPRS